MTVAEITIPVLRRLVADAPWAQDRLRPYAGHEIRWDLAGLRGHCRIDAAGLPALDPEPPAAETPPPGVRLRLAAEHLDALGGGFDALMRKVAIEGNAGLAAELAFVARHLRPDPEEWLAPWLGDAAAERMGQGLRSGLRFGARTAARLAEAGTEFAVHEARLLADPEAVARHCAEVDLLREGADRLAQRVRRLDALLAAAARAAEGH